MQENSGAGCQNEHQSSNTEVRGEAYSPLTHSRKGSLKHALKNKRQGVGVGGGRRGAFKGWSWISNFLNINYY